MKEVVNRLYLSRLYQLIHRLTVQQLEWNPTIHSGLGKTLIRTAGVLQDKSFFVLISNHILPDLIKPCGELSGVYLRCILRVYGYDEGIQYFSQCSLHNKHYRVILPEMLFGKTIMTSSS